MELNEFIEEFLPDYNAKRITYRYGIDNFLIDFPEALNNFTDKICERQRELCARHHDDAFATCVFDAILNAPQPKIDDLL